MSLLNESQASEMTSLQQFVFNFTQQLGRIEADRKKYDFASKQANVNYKLVHF